jgi:hypothetical protein
MLALLYNEPQYSGLDEYIPIKPALAQRDPSLHIHNKVSSNGYAAGAADLSTSNNNINTNTNSNFNYDSSQNAPKSIRGWPASYPLPASVIKPHRPPPQLSPTRLPVRNELQPRTACDKSYMKPLRREQPCPVIEQREQRQQQKSYEQQLSQQREIADVGYGSQATATLLRLVSLDNKLEQLQHISATHDDGAVERKLDVGNVFSHLTIYVGNALDMFDEICDAGYGSHITEQGFGMFALMDPSGYKIIVNQRS